MKFYECSDLNLAAALQIRGAKLMKINNNKSHKTFVFDNPQLCGEVVLQWYNDELQVSARQYANTLKNLKTLLYTSAD